MGLDEFLIAANQHFPCSIEWGVEGTVFQCAVDETGTFTKACVRVDGDEPDEIRRLLLDKSMQVRFEKGEFPREWVTSISEGLEPFEGGLKTAIFDFLFAVAPRGRCPVCRQVFDPGVDQCPLHGRALIPDSSSRALALDRNITARASSRLIESLLAGEPVAMLQVFVFRDGVYLGSEVFGDQVVIGAGEDADLRLDSTHVEDVHAILRHSNGELSIQRFGNTAINRASISGTRKFTAQDEIQIGSYALKVRVGGPRGLSASQAERPARPKRRGSCPVCDGVFEFETAGRKPRCPEHGRLLVSATNSEAPAIPLTAPIAIPEPPRAPSPRLVAEGDQIGKYRIGRVLSDRGSQSTIHLAVDTTLNRTVAIKVFKVELGSDEDNQFKRFVREPNLLARIQHQNVVTVFEFLPEVPAIVMEHIEGVSLTVYLAAEERLRAPVAIEILTQVCAGVQAAHDVGLIHRDLKPANIMLTPQSTGFRVRVLDFGVARDQGRVTKLSGGYVGTMAYSAPEQWIGKNIGTSADVYAVGIIAYQCLAGRLPFLARSPVALMQEHESHDPPPFPDDLEEKAQALEPIVKKALEKRPADRFPSMDELARALRSPPPEAPRGIIDKLFG